MKKHNKPIILTALIITIITVFCSCTAPNTVSTDTEYKLAMITELFPVEGLENYQLAETAIKGDTVSASAWKALNEYRKTTYDSSLKTVEAIKYYTPAEAKGSDNVSYSVAFREAAKKQFELAAAGKANLIVTTNDDFSQAYLECKDVTKTFGEVSFVLITVPGSIVSNPASLNAKTTAVVIDTAQYGYLFGYYAAEKGFKKVGYVGADNNTSAAFSAGLKKAAEDLGIEIVTTLTSSGPIEAIIKEDIAKTDAELLIGDELTMSYVASSGKKYASIYKDDAAQFYVTADTEVLTSKLTAVITTARQTTAGTVKTLSASDGIFISSEGTLPKIPDITVPGATDTQTGETTTQ